MTFQSFAEKAAEMGYPEDIAEERWENYTKCISEGKKELAELYLKDVLRKRYIPMEESVDSDHFFAMGWDSDTEYTAIVKEVAAECVAAMTDTDRENFCAALT